MVAIVALPLVEHPEEDGQDGFPTSTGVSLAVDVEQDHIGVAGHGPLHVAKQHGVFDLFLEELHGPLGLALERVRLVVQQVGQDFQEVTLTRSEEPRDPNAHLAGDGRIVFLVDGFQVGCQKLAEVLVQFLGDDELI